MTIGAVRLHDQYTLGISEHGNVRVVRDENQLAMFFDTLDVLDDKAVNKLVIKVVLRLVNQKRFAVRLQFENLLQNDMLPTPLEWKCFVQQPPPV